MGIAREWAGRAPNDEGKDERARRTLKVTVTLEPQTTLSEVLTWVQDRGMGSHEVIVTGGHLTFTRQETTVEAIERLQALDKAKARSRAAIKERYEALFGDTKPSEVK